MTNLPVRRRWFWAVERIEGPSWVMYYCGFFWVVRDEGRGWRWGGWNRD